MVQTPYLSESSKIFRSLVCMSQFSMQLSEQCASSVVFVWHTCQHMFSKQQRSWDQTPAHALLQNSPLQTAQNKYSSVIEKKDQPSKHALQTQSTRGQKCCFHPQCPIGHMLIYITIDH